MKEKILVVLNNKRNIMAKQMLYNLNPDYQELLFQIDEEIRKIIKDSEANGLNDEVEILDNEDEKNNFTGWKMYQDGKEVCSMDCSVNGNEDEDIEEIDFKTAGTQKEKNRIMKDKINELVREVNKLKKEGK